MVLKQTNSYSHRGKQLMLCFYCSSTLIWGNDLDISHEDEEYAIETNLSCSNPDCNAQVLTYLPKASISDD